MLHRALAVAVLLVCLGASQLWAQGTELRIETESASIHLSPSTGSPVIGHANRGAVLEITRDLGSWVRVSWPAAEAGAGYVHVSTGTRTGARRSAAIEASQPLPAAPPVHETVSEHSTRPVQPTYVAPPAHVVGLGGRIGDSTVGPGASVRAWPRERLGVQLEVSRSSLTSAVGTDRLTAIQFAPSVLYALPDRVTDYVWLRPYLGAGPRFLRQTLYAGARPDGAGLSESRLGVQAFGGAELTFATLPSLALSAGLQYGWLRNPTAGFELGGLGVSVSAHWYVK